MRDNRAVCRAVLWQLYESRISHDAADRFRTNIEPCAASPYITVDRSPRFPEDLGQMVHDRRVALGFTQAELAERAGMTQPQLSRLESGGAMPTVPLLARLAGALNADLDIAFRPHTPAAA